MSTLQNRIDFAFIISVKNANPNGDPMTSGSPREDFNGYGEISDVCLKSKIRNRLNAMGCKVILSKNYKFTRNDQLLTNVKNTIKATATKDDKTAAKGIPTANDKIYNAFCEQWDDIRAFGMVIPVKGESVSLGIRGPVTIGTAVSLSPIDTATLQITRCDTLTGNYGDTMGIKYKTSGVYVAYGGITCQLAELTGFSEEDSENIKEALRTLFQGDESAQRPAGSMAVEKLFWWRHNNKAGQYSPARVHRSLKIDPIEEPPFYTYAISPLPGIDPEIIDGW